MSEIHYSEIVEKALRHAVAIFNSNDYRKMVYHNYQFCVDLCNTAHEIAKSEKEISNKELEQAQLAGIFYTLGKAENENQTATSLWNQSAKQIGADDELVRQVNSCITSLIDKEAKNTNAKKLLADCVHAQSYAQAESTNRSLFKMEALSIANKEVSNLEWNSQQQETIEAIDFNFPFSTLKFKPVLNQQLLEYLSLIHI